MLFHPFVLSGDLTVRLSVELLQRVRNPGGSSGSGSASTASASAAGEDEADEEEETTAAAPRRISSRTPRDRQKTQSELNSECWPAFVLSHY